MIPMVLAGGFGTRIRPLSVNHPKPVLPIVNRPLIARALEQIARAGWSEALLLTFHQSDAIRAVLGDGEALGLRLRYVEDDEDRGTAGAVARAAAQAGEPPYLVVSGDLLTDFDLAAILASHRAKRAAASLALARVANPLQFGVVITDSDAWVRRFLEKPTWGEVFSDTVNAGIFVLEERALAEVPAKEPTDFARDLFPRLLERGLPLHGRLCEGYWRDVGDVESYLAAHVDFFSGALRVTPPGSPRHVGPKLVHAEGATQLGRGVELRGAVVLGDGCRVEAGARLEDVVLGPGTVVGEGADLRRAVLWEGVTIGAGARVEGSVLCSRVRIGSGTIIETGAVVADETVLGDEVRVKEGVRIWPGKIVEDHAVVHSNLVWADRWRTSTFEEAAVTGLTNLELTPEVAARLGVAYGTLLAPGSTVLSVRDAHPASRMLRRAFVGGVGSAGVNMVDLGLLPVPVMRYRLERAGETGGVSFRQVRRVKGMTSIRFFDGGGLDISTAFAKSVERVFLREEFRRAPHDEIGVITDLPHIVDAYQEAYLAALDVKAIRARRFHLVIDYAHTAAVVLLPALLAELGCQVVTLNALTDGVGLARSPDDGADAQSRLASITTALGADLGVWLSPGNERLVLVDGGGRTWADMELTGLVVEALARAAPHGRVVLPSYAPSTFRSRLAGAGHQVVEVLSAPRAMIEASYEHDVRLATAGDGRLVFPGLHHAPDALFALGAMLELLARAGASPADLGRLAPEVTTAAAALACPVDRKGVVMRAFAEHAAGRIAAYLDGVRISLAHGWVLLRPDRVDGRVHLYAEAEDAAATTALLAEYRDMVARLIREA